MRGSALAYVAFVLAGACLVAGCSASTVTRAPQLCPQATPEWLRVEPLTSPTDRLSQTVRVLMGNMEAVTITTQSGVFASTGPDVDVTLLRDTSHHLEVVAKVREIWRDGCQYGGYTLRTERDKNGALLIIQQGQPALPVLPGAAITPDNVHQLKTLSALAPDARLTSDFAFRTDEELISVGYVHKISRWDATTGQELDPIAEGLEESAALNIAIGPDPSLIATAGTAEGYGLNLWNTTTGEMRELGGHGYPLKTLAFSPSGTRLAGGGNDDNVWIWDLASGQLAASFQGDVPDRLQSFDGLFWVDDTTLIAAASDAIYWWDVATGRLLERLARPEEAAFFVAFAFSRDGNRLAAVAQDEKVYLWDRGIAGWAIWPAQAGTRMNHVEFSPDGRLLASTTFEGELLLWNAGTAELLVSDSVTSGDITAVRFSPDGQYLAVGGWDSVIWLLGVP
jgi:WD40 repeat protein